MADSTFYVLKSTPPFLAGTKPARNFRGGDIVDVLPMGAWPGDHVHPSHINSKKKWYLIHVIGLDPVLARKYIQPDIIDTGMVDGRGRKILKQKSKRKFKLPLQLLPVLIERQLAKTYEITITKKQLLQFLVRKP